MIQSLNIHINNITINGLFLQGEGVAYRGRVLVKIETKLGDHPEQNLVEMDNAEIQRVGKVLGRRKYRLYCAILDATMVSESDDPVEFEVSIGNYGNKLDDSVAPQPSTTQPTNAVYDGCKYYFLPWSENKPLLIVNSDWEDISFRLDSLNMILRKIERLVRSGKCRNLDRELFCCNNKDN